MLFHFANGPLLPLVGQKLALANPEFATAMMSSCIVAAQLAMPPYTFFQLQPKHLRGAEFGYAFWVRDVKMNIS